MLRAALLAIIAVTLSLSSCARPPAVGSLSLRTGDEISVCGELFHTGTPVVLWYDRGGYDAYRVGPRFSPSPGEGAPGEQARYGVRRNLPPGIAERVATDGWQLEDLQQVVHTLVLHYDAAGSSRQCFKILQDIRGLSVHFMLDVDGTIYQSLDLKERAWHAGVANDGSIGIEIAQIGARTTPDDAALKNWYRRDSAGMRVEFPDWLADTGVRTPGFIARSARPDLISGQIHGTTYYQYDFTPEQYAALARLTAALHRVLPRIKLTIPRAPSGQVLPAVLSTEALDRFEGIIGHWHVTTRKNDPGPAFDWQRLLTEARGYL